MGGGRREEVWQLDCQISAVTRSLPTLSEEEFIVTDLGGKQRDGERCSVYFLVTVESL